MNVLLVQLIVVRIAITLMEAITVHVDQAMISVVTMPRV